MTIKKTPYAWTNVALGGGGYITGLEIHPAQKDLVYIRTDGAGVFRWKENSRTWTPLLDYLGLEGRNMYGIDGLALDPHHPETLYAAAGADRLRGPAYPSAILKSVDYGDHWSNCGPVMKHTGNETFKYAGESIAVDPLNSRVVYAGTRYEGLWVTRDGGATWTQANGIPEEHEDAKGVRSIVFDRETADGGSGRTNRVYAGVIGKGIYVSDNGGSNFQLLDGSPLHPHRMVSRNGKLWVTSREGFFLFDEKGWQECSPVPGRPYNGFSVDSRDESHLVVAEMKYAFHNIIYRSMDGGATWTDVSGKSTVIPGNPWLPKERFGAAIAALVLDPHRPNRAWMTDWYCVWMTEDISADSPVWHSYVQGLENMVTFSMATPPGGARFFSAVADNDGFRHEEVDLFPAQAYHGPFMQETTGIDYVYADPRILARVGSWDRGARGNGGYSLDNGVTWTEFASYPEKDGIRMPNGKIALSCRILPETGFPIAVTVPIGARPYYSLDLGETWQESHGAPEGAVGDFWSYHHPLAADRVDPYRFYLYHSGGCYVSTDGGRNWALRSRLPADGFPHLKAAPGLAGEVWISLEHKGLFRSGDGGLSFMRVEVVDRCRIVAFGKSAPGGVYPTVYVYGTLQGQAGVFRSLNMGQQWEQINDDRHGLGKAFIMEADLQEFGGVYIGTDGRGYYYGKPQAE